MVLNLKTCTASPKRDIVILLTGPVALTGELIPPKVPAGCRRQVEGLPAQTLPRNTPTLLPRNVSYVTKTPCRFDTSHKTYTPAHFTLEIVMMLDYNRYKIVSSTPIIEIRGTSKNPLKIRSKCSAGIEIATFATTLSKHR